MTQLSVNVNKLATLRNARGQNRPDVLKTSLDIVSFGAEGITVHPRPDGRHIRREDVYTLKENLDVEFNIEGYPSEDFLHMVCEVKPEQCTLVPDPPDVLTSNAGWHVEENRNLLSASIEKLKREGVRVSLFIDPKDVIGNSNELPLLKKLNADRIELYTEAYAKAYGTKEQQDITEIYKKVAATARDCQLGVNAGHDLDLDNLTYLVKNIPIDEVSIGHALICDALTMGLEQTVKSYLNCLS